MSILCSGMGHEHKKQQKIPGLGTDGNVSQHLGSIDGRGMAKRCLACCAGVNIAQVSGLGWLPANFQKKNLSFCWLFFCLFICFVFYDCRRVFISSVRSYLMFLFLLPYSSDVWCWNTPLKCCWVLPPRGCISVATWERQTMK